MTGDQGTLDSSLGGGYLSKASSFGPVIFKTIELVSLRGWSSGCPAAKHLMLIKLIPSSRGTFRDADVVEKILFVMLEGAVRKTMF